MEGIFYVLVLLACPVGMGVMMWYMGRGSKGKAAATGAKVDSVREGSSDGSIEDLRREQARLGEEIERLSPGKETGNGRLAGSRR
ncbi:MAG: hypothetical protein ACR2NV_06140 [Thermoleophilaceae bacterium]